MRTHQLKTIGWQVVLAGVLSLGLLRPGTGFATQEKKNLCHLEGNGSYTIITIPEPAWQTHFDHGDMDVITYYEDNDGDGFGTTASTLEDCVLPEGYAAAEGDCDDTDAAVNPGATEIPGNGLDDDCNPATPDEPAVTCPCEGLESNETSWNDTFATSSCSSISGGGYEIIGSGGQRLALIVISHPGGEDYECGLYDDGIHISTGADVEGPAEAEACLVSLSQIAANDGVTCQ